jgi:hypothetical protein
MSPGRPPPVGAPTSQGPIAGLYADWQAGRVTVDQVRDFLPVLWLAYGSHRETSAILALLAVTGPLIAADVSLPGHFDVYRGQCVGEPPGIAWTPHLQNARQYADRWTQERRSRGDSVLPMVLHGTARPADVLLVSSLCTQFVIRPESVRDVTPASEADTTGWPAWWPKPSPADVVASVRGRLGAILRYKQREHPWIATPGVLDQLVDMGVSQLVQRELGRQRG